ncbi:MAG: hypothetical protein CL525_07880, partial [Aequorivita sp.]|nr:hypothetical protein [Aequorivita sp.]
RAVDSIDIPEIDLNPYSTVQSLATTRAELETQINTFKSNLEAELLLVKDNLSAVDTDLINTINSKVTPEQLAAVSAAIPDISQLTTETTVDSKIAAITNDFLPRTGGRYTGGITMDKVDSSQAGFDFSSSPSSGLNALKFRSLGGANDYASFGTTNNFWEYAWKFDSEEDFCWVYNDDNKVFSITKEGPACSTMILGDIGDNTQHGRTVHNKIDVRDRLETYQTAFEHMRQSIANATNFDELKSNLSAALASV